MHKHNFGQTLKLQKCCGYLEYEVNVIKSNSLFYVSKQSIYASLAKKTPQSSEKADFTVF